MLRDKFIHYFQQWRERQLSREAVMPGYISEGVSLNYLAMFTLVTLFIGLALYRTREEAMLTS